MLDPTHRTTSFHLAGAQEPPESHLIGNFGFRSHVPVRSTNLPAQKISNATTFAGNPIPHVNTANPGKRIFRL